MLLIMRGFVRENLTRGAAATDIASEKRPQAQILTSRLAGFTLQRFWG